MVFLRLCAAASLLAAANAVPFKGMHITDKRQLAASYDYVVVGGGASGLTVANRLSEDSGQFDSDITRLGSPATAEIDIEI